MASDTHQVKVLRPAQNVLLWTHWASRQALKQRTVHMKRRDFLKTGVQGGMAGLTAAAALNSPSQASAAAQTPASQDAPAVFKSYTAEDHRKRLQSIAVCEKAIRGCMRKHLITDYLPAQACYNLGEYPSRTPWAPNDYDEQELDRLRDHGIQIIQLFDDWNDSLRLFGGHKLSAVNPEGMRRFVEMVHRRGMKIIAYVSTGFLQRTDPDFRQEWSREGDFLTLGFWNMARCSPASAGWRAYLLPRILNVLDDYGFDGLYNDCGYVTNANKTSAPPTSDEVLAFEEAPDFDGALTDLLQLLYGEVKRRGGILKLHVNTADQPLTRGAKVYDYLWVGEGVDNTDLMRERVKNYPPYVVPCIDMTFAKVQNLDEPFLHAIPYMQFPVLQGGRPFTGERAMIPGVVYTSPDDFWMKRCRDAWEWYKAHPDGPYLYGGWDTFPPRADERPTHAQWLKRYAPLAEDGTVAWLEIADNTLFAAPLPKNVVASAFANRDVHLVLANYGPDPIDLATTDPYTTASDSSPKTQFRLAPRSLEILKHST
jgi:hypothetical protein